MKNINLEISDFKTIIETNSLYIDKTLLIKDIIDTSVKCLCFVRPRRFCKSVSMSMLNYYFNIEYKDNKLFDGLKIMNQGDIYFDEMNKYPVISISFKELKSNTYQEFIDDYKKFIFRLYLKYKFILESDKVSEPNKNIFEDYYYMRTDNLTGAIADLMLMLREYYDSEVIVLLDEYDVPILRGYLKGYYDDIIEFIKKVFETTFKDNLDLKKGIVTGVLRIAIEELGTGANNFKTYNITDNMYSSYFGFTEREVEDILKEYGLSDTFDEVKKWYDGYLFGNTTIYNPVSILNYLESQKFESYWVNTGGVDLLKNLIFNIKDKTNLLDEFHELLKTGVINNVDLDLKMNLKRLNGNPDTVWTLFMLNGYLTTDSEIFNLKNVTLKIPNLEVKENLESIAASWFLDDYKGNKIVKLLIDREIDEFKDNLEKIVLTSFSFMDVPGNSESEAFYHSFVLGLLTSENDYYEVTSNRESGYGRYDILLKPKVNNIPAYIIEFKLVRDDTTFENTIETAFSQIEAMKYDASVKNLDVIKMAIAFRGKKLQLETR